MQYLALATDYDGTLATEGEVDPPTVAALERLLATGRRLLMVTGRELPDLKSAFGRLDLFDLVVAENGALLHDPAEGKEELLAPPPPAEFVKTLRRQGVPLTTGRSTMATVRPYDRQVLAAIRSLNLDLQVVFNNEAVMVMAKGVDKASGLAAALSRLGLSPANVVAVGDAENDQVMLESCGASASVANALPALKRRADIVTKGSRGAGVTEVIEALIADDLRGLKRAGGRQSGAG